MALFPWTCKLKIDEIKKDKIYNLLFYLHSLADYIFFTDSRTGNRGVKQGWIFFLKNFSHFWILSFQKRYTCPNKKLETSELFSEKWWKVDLHQISTLEPNLPRIF
jgi:hypothetical protein